MAKIRLKKKKVRYATVSRELLANPNISLRAKGLGAWLELHQDGFELNFEFILQSMKEGRDTLRKVLKELKEEDFLVTIQTRNKNGKFETTWIFDSEGGVFDEDLPTTEIPEAVTPQAAVPEAVKPTQIRKHTIRKYKKENSLSKGVDFLKSKDTFINHIRANFKNQLILEGMDTYNQKPIAISVSHQGYLYNLRMGENFPGVRAKEMWTNLYSLALEGRLKSIEEEKKHA